MLKKVKKLLEIIKKWSLFLIIKFHLLMKKEPENKKIFNVFSDLIFGITFIIISVLITPNIYNYFKNLMSIDENCAVGITALLWIILMATYKFIIVSINILSESEIYISTRYKLLISILSVPATILFHAFLIPLFKILALKTENYYKKIVLWEKNYLK